MKRIAAVALLTFPLSCAAGAATLPAYQVVVSAIAGENEHAVSGDPETHGANTTASATWPPPGGSGVNSAEARATVSTGQVILLQAIVDQTDNPYSFGIGQASALGSLTYSFMLEGPEALNPIDVSMEGSNSLNVRPLRNPELANDGPIEARWSVDVFNPDGQVVLQFGQSDVGLGESYFLNNTGMLANVVYTVVMEAELAIGPAHASRQLTLDPYISIVDPQLASQYRIVFSEGVVNGSPLSEVPLPAALPLFAAGLGVVGFVARRKKRAQNAVA